MLLFVALVLVAAVLLFVFGVRGRDLPPADPISPTSVLEERRARVYENLRDLQFEYRVGKLSEGDYQRTKSELQKELAGILAELDMLSAAPLAVPASVAAAPAPPPRPATPYLCPHCGAGFDIALKFCGQCGKRMEIHA